MGQLIAASDAVLDAGKLLPQHQAILVVIQDILNDPALETFEWLDLACGRGQIIVQLEHNLPSRLREKICWTGFDAQNDFLMKAVKRAETLGFRKVEYESGYLARFPAIIPDTKKFDLITFTNAAHEITPLSLTTVLLEGTLRLREDGRLFFYDMESLPAGHSELGAVTWLTTEIEEIMETFCHHLGVVGYRPACGNWKHSSCGAWNIHLRKKHLNISDPDIAARKGFVIDATGDVIRSILSRKLKACRSALETVTVYGPENVSEVGYTSRLLHDLWALTRALEVLL
jgi:ubiquinone/menaquinone biosynthesis C-methylase UbiE